MFSSTFTITFLKNELYFLYYLVFLGQFLLFLCFSFLSSVDHPNIVSFYGVYRLGLNLFMVSEFMNRGSLTDIIISSTEPFRFFNCNLTQHMQFFIMPFLSGFFNIKNLLFTFSTHVSCYSQQTIVAYAKQICRGVSFLHSRKRPNSSGIIHGHLTSSNVLVLEFVLRVIKCHICLLVHSYFLCMCFVVIFRLTLWVRLKSVI